METVNEVYMFFVREKQIWQKKSNFEIQARFLLKRSKPEEVTVMALGYIKKYQKRQCCI